MKNFKRKLARVFGLALRSDLLKVHESYDRSCAFIEEKTKDTERYRKLWKDTQRSFDQYIKNHA